MKFKYSFQSKNNNQTLVAQIDSAADRLYHKLRMLDLSQIALSDYNRKYLISDHLSNLTRTLQKYSYILFNSAHAAQLPLNEITFLEYGGGIGILSLLAREAGIKSVVYNDIYDVSCADAQFLADGLQLTADHYICGDIDEVINYVEQHRVICNVVASYDVIEHVYDIEPFMKKLGDISPAKNFVIFMSSGANGYNPRIKKTLQEHHQDHELNDRSQSWGHKHRDCLESFFSVRKKMIQEYDATLSQKEVIALARATRGKIKSDIHRAVDLYKKTNTLPEVPTCTDTCDPYTGNWSEHIMDPYQLSDILKSCGFESKVLCGYYGDQKNPIKKTISNTLNMTIRFTPATIGLRVAPFYTIFGVRK